MIPRNAEPPQTDGCPDGDGPPASCLMDCPEAGAYPPERLPAAEPRAETAGTGGPRAAQPQPVDAHIPKIVDRWIAAENYFLASLLSPLSQNPSWQVNRVVVALDAHQRTMPSYTWAFPEHRDIFAAIIAECEQDFAPSADTVSAELTRRGSRGAALKARELGRLLPSDGMADSYLRQMVELGRTATAYALLVRGAHALENGQAVADQLPTIERLRELAQPVKGDNLSILSAADLVSLFPALRPYIIERLLRQGETMNLIAAPKIGKSWLLMAMLLAIASGSDWLGFPCTTGRVLLLDNELHPETLAKRIMVVADAMGINLADLGDRLSVVPLRGQQQDINALERTFDRIKPGEYSMIGIDALYRMLPRDCEENSNENMRDVYNLLDLYANQIQSAFGLVHHSSKGDQSQKSVTDTGSGAGAISRAADVHCIIRPHEEADCAVMDCRIRSGAQPAPMGLRWNYPLWVPEPALDVEALATTTRRRKKAGAEPEPKANYMTVANIALSEPKPLAFFTAKTGLNQMNCRRFLAEAVEVGALHLWPGRAARDPQRWATEPPNLRALVCVKTPPYPPRVLLHTAGLVSVSATHTAKQTRTREPKP